MVQFASYLRRVLCKRRLIFPRINGPNDPHDLTYLGQMEWLFANSRERKRQEKTERKSAKKNNRIDAI